jgi:hypothetical protein
VQSAVCGSALAHSDMDGWCDIELTVNLKRAKELGTTMPRLADLESRQDYRIASLMSGPGAFLGHAEPA